MNPSRKGPHELDGIPAASLDDEDLERELEHLHQTRHEVFLHGSAQALDHHTQRMADLEQEWLRRHPERQVDPQRLRAGARTRDTARH
jgi:hypothetical protein